MRTKQEWWVKKLFDGMPTFPTHPAFNLLSLSKVAQFPYINYP